MSDTLDLSHVDLQTMQCPRCAAPLPGTVRFYGPCPDCVTALRADAEAAARRRGATQDGDASPGPDDAPDRPLQGQERALNS
jgi:hypothetical protein